MHDLIIHTEVVDFGVKTDNVEELQQPAVRLQSVSHEYTANQLSAYHIIHANYTANQLSTHHIMHANYTLTTDGRERKLKSFPSPKTHRAALISILLALSQGCHSLDISIAPTLGMIITELLRPALWTLLVIGD